MFKPKVKLVGTNGNVFALLGACKTASKKANWTPEQWGSFYKEATSGDYDNALRAMTTHFEVD